MTRVSEILRLKLIPASIAAAVLFGMPDPATAQSNPPSDRLDGPTIGHYIYDRPDPETGRYSMTMTLTRRSGSKRTRQTIVLRQDTDEMHRFLMFFQAPTNVKGTAFLTYDYANATRADDRWLYLPAMRRIRRISASDRGDYFLGTDFTYQDIQDTSKFSPDDYTFKRGEDEAVDGVTAYRIHMTPRSPKIADELGYGRVSALVNPANWMPLKADYWDTNDNRLKTVTLDDIEEIQGIWTAKRLTAVNHKTGHTTELVNEEITYGIEIDDVALTPEGLRRGIE